MKTAASVEQLRAVVRNTSPSKEAIAEELYNNLGMQGRSDFTHAHALSIILAAIDKAMQLKSRAA